MRTRPTITLILALVMFLGCGVAARADSISANQPLGAQGSVPYRGNGLSTDPSFFPIGVWYQDPVVDAQAFKTIGVNTFIGQQDGDTPDSIAALRAAGMIAIAPQDTVSLEPSSGDVVKAWHDTADEPDIGPLDASGARIQPVVPVPPSNVVATYDSLKAKGGGLPVYVNFGPGVALNGAEAGARRYEPYIQGADIVSFDIYPLNPGIYGRSTPMPISLIADGVDHLRAWAPDKPVFAFIETTDIDGDAPSPTPAQIRDEVWLALIHGANGIEYFCHEMHPVLIADACLRDPTTRQALAGVDAEVSSLAPVLNIGSQAASPPDVEASFRVDRTIREYGADTYVFAESVGQESHGPVTFQVPGIAGGAAQVIGENRSIPVHDGKFTDHFQGQQVHLYRITPKA